MTLPARKPESSMGSWDLVFSSQTETESFGHAMGKSVAGGEVLALIGELGAGKTALVKGIATGLGASTDSVSSPTFILIHEYQGRLPLVHVDLYRLRTETEAHHIGLPDYFTERSIVAIEWADRFPGLLPPDRLELRLSHRTPESRALQVQAHGPHAQKLLVNMKETWLSQRRHEANNTVPRKTLPR
jgi:tRNA threonylcarbamoyladenosine biosynthesis protein TsaE